MLRPSRAAYLRTLRANAVIGGILLVVVIVRALLNPVYLIVLVVTVAISIGAVIFYFRTTRIEFADGRYTLHRWGMARTFLAADVQVVLTLDQYRVNYNLLAPQLIVIGNGARRLLRLGGTTWGTEALGPIANDMMARGVAHEHVAEPITPGQLNERFPYAVGWAERHPVLLGLAIALGVIVLVTLIVIVGLVLSQSGLS